MFGKRSSGSSNGPYDDVIGRLKKRGGGGDGGGGDGKVMPFPGVAKPRTKTGGKARTKTGGNSGAKLAAKPGRKLLGGSEGGIEVLRVRMEPLLKQRIGLAQAARMTRRQLAADITRIVGDVLDRENAALDALDQRNLVTALVTGLIEEARAAAGDKDSLFPSEAGNRTDPDSNPDAPAHRRGERGTSRSSIEDAKKRIQPTLVERIDASMAAKLARPELARQVGEITSEILGEEKIQLNQIERRDLVTTLLHDMLGLGPLEPLLADESINDILVNGAGQIYVERHGKLELTDVTFRDDAHVMNVATRIVTAMGRRIDESSPLVDARLADGSRVNIIIPPLAIDGPSISIRKFSKKGITLDVMESQNNLSPEMATVLRIAARSRLNILISGGTGSGKTTLLNALSQMIDSGERIVTIEDAAELQLQQPHVVRLETRPTNLEGEGEVTMRDLVKNALRMRPDRIILGEVRGAEAVDMLQAMNTGHEGSLGTVHANRPREALTRLENMIGLAGINLAPKAVRTQIADALDLIVQVSRMRDGMRRITNIMEVVGTEGDVITTQELFTYCFEGENSDGSLRGHFESSGLRPHFTAKAEYFGLGKTLLEAVS